MCELIGIGPAHTPGTTVFEGIEELKPASFMIVRKDNRGLHDFVAGTKVKYIGYEEKKREAKIEEEQAVLISEKEIKRFIVASGGNFLILYLFVKRCLD